MQGIFRERRVWLIRGAIWWLLFGGTGDWCTSCPLTLISKHQQRCREWTEMVQAIQCPVVKYKNFMGGLTMRINSETTTMSAASPEPILVYLRLCCSKCLHPMEALPARAPGRCEHASAVAQELPTGCSSYTEALDVFACPLWPPQSGCHHYRDKLLQCNRDQGP